MTQLPDLVRYTVIPNSSQTHLPAKPCEHCGSYANTVREHCHQHGWIRGICCQRFNRALAFADRGKVLAGHDEDTLSAWLLRCPDCQPRPLAPFIPSRAPRTTPVSVTPEARKALAELAIDLSHAARERVTQSDALRIAAKITASHPDEIGAALASLAPDDDAVTPLFGKEGK